MTALPSRFPLRPDVPSSFMRPARRQRAVRQPARADPAAPTLCEIDCDPLPCQPAPEPATNIRPPTQLHAIEYSECIVYSTRVSCSRVHTTRRQAFNRTLLD